VALAKGAEVILEEVRRVLGTYEYGWPALAESTLDRKAGDTPGLETGEMRDSYDYTIETDGAYVGSPLEKALFFEMGTRTQPPRPVLSEAAARTGEHAADEIVRHIFETTLFRR
jgi:hypothetical protein